MCGLACSMCSVNVDEILTFMEMLGYENLSEFVKLSEKGSWVWEILVICSFGAYFVRKLGDYFRLPHDLDEIAIHSTEVSWAPAMCQALC